MQNNNNAQQIIDCANITIIPMKMESLLSGSLSMTSINLMMFLCGAKLFKIFTSSVWNSLMSASFLSLLLMCSFNFLLFDTPNNEGNASSSEDVEEEEDDIDDTSLLLLFAGPD